ncbi:SRPBCC domain-containing protein [Deinococcus alpinitundrae]|uniref:SRPBCC domain-containing protein n=1 Tax=Deinococcus alpinitundrae TaxID=468913 RepID=UPI00137A8229|nr:SRPBCC domain-containing protein [Deinococcus alpinitundrae]
MSDAVRAVLQRELTLRHVFHAPCALVFQAWTDPAYLAQWWGPEGYTNPVVEVDARPSGALYSLFASAYLIKAQSLPESVKQIETLVEFWRGSQSVSWSTAKD